MNRAGDRREQAWALAVLGMVGVDQGDLRPDLPTVLHDRGRSMPSSQRANLNSGIADCAASASATQAGCSLSVTATALTANVYP
jgi:hypothetical protein